MDFRHFFILQLIVFSTLFIGILGDCPNPKVESSTYTSGDAFFSTETVYSIELTVTCSNNQAPSLYAFVNNELILVTKSTSSNSYQVSWSLPHNKAVKGTIPVGFYDDEGASTMRKNMRYGEDVKVDPLFTVDVEHKGIKTQSFIAPGFVAMLLSLLVWWLANTARQKLME
ncbi:PREDICTED: translocon-associated protein subunit delta-like [Amphimedon queenslandica]|uniref:Translocon-associated protein subunit delta n=1 Tax=Amphimedon queenslandica TaxID=400682 RepID=A0A1X7UVD6_AMPQE|nr:PREDICTED: translocon-associated protein subunit delta-like [Amphimedon queenslandica]|eukprot:XP_003386631.1 PREDICTED: translocon-associated protein subunit delta-like [Amphimedon queenslandica]